ncbi:MAG: fibronectin type III domain-containing protein [Candidatus Daviesbacteria bacterium]|nr:fibronectin type III domain-containing protein [Candidatus Daviesbacteria bacterium]
MTFKLYFTKVNNGIIKIPTLLGMGVLLIGLVGGVFLVTQNQTLKSKAAVSSEPKNVNVVNINSTSVSIYWQTDEQTTGFIKAGIAQQERKLFLDDRDLASPAPHKLHFVTLTNLQPETTYYYQIYSGAITYPKEALNFKTIAEAQSVNWPPLVGTIINENNSVLDEAIIILNLPEAQKLATITKTGGNFILPLSGIRLQNSTTQSSTQAKLDILGIASTAEATVLIPPQETSLPPIKLGTSVDLTQINKTTPQITPKTSSLSAEMVKFDTNSDGVINFTDLSLILQNFGSLSDKTKNPKADLNNDKVIDQKDANLLLPYLK